MTNWYQTHAFKPLALNSDAPLPALTVIALDHLNLITANGADTISYLQGQLTCDLVSLAKNDVTLAAHCDAKGKVWSVLRLFHHLDGIGYIQPAAVTDIQLNEIKKYAIFSKVTFAVSEYVLLGVAGKKADNTMQARFTGTGDVRQTETGTAIKLDTNCWVLAISPAEADALLYDLGGRAELSDNTLWQLIEIKAGIPSITAATTNEFIPQSLNLQALNAISFKKGCYTGQETIARAKYRGINKRAAYLLQGVAETTPVAGDVVDRSVGSNWRKGGTVLAGYRFADGIAQALVVLPNDLDDVETKFRLADAEHPWQKQGLPYEIEQ